MAKHDLDIRGRAWALEQLGTVHDSIAPTRGASSRSASTSRLLRGTALTQMAHDANDATRAVVRVALRDGDGSVRTTALQVLAILAPAQARAAADTLLVSDPDNGVREAAPHGDRGVGGAGRRSTCWVRSAGTDQPGGIRSTAVRWLGRLRDPRAEDVLERLTATNEDRGLRTSALNALVSTGDSARATAVAIRLGWRLRPDPRGLGGQCRGGRGRSGGADPPDGSAGDRDADAGAGRDSGGAGSRCYEIVVSRWFSAHSQRRAEERDSNPPRACARRFSRPAALPIRSIPPSTS